MSSWMRTGGDHDAELGRDLAADDADAREQRAAGALVDDRHEAEADRELERVDRRARRGWLAGGAAGGGLLLALRPPSCALASAAMRPFEARPSRRRRRRR